MNKVKGPVGLKHGLEKGKIRQNKGPWRAKQGFICSCFYFRKIMTDIGYIIMIIGMMRT